MYKAITARQGERLSRRLGLDYGGDGRTFYATNDNETSVFEFESKKERDNFIKRHNKYLETL